MKKSIRLLLSFLSFSLLFFSCSNNLESNSLVISFNLQNQKNQNVQRAATYSENSYVTVIMYDVENMEDQIEDIPDFKIIQKQTVPVKNNSARITFNDITVGTKSIIKAQITCEYKILYEGQSQIFVVSEGKNTITINLNDPQNPRDLSYNADDGILEIYTEEGLKKFRDIVNNSIIEPISVDDAVFYPDDPNNQSVNAKLCRDIELSDGSDWVPIGYSKQSGIKSYRGTFYGNGKCVTNLNTDSTTTTDLGFFGCVQDATIMNLYVQGNISSPSTNTDYTVGGIVGYAKSTGNNSVKIINCINNVKINSQSTFVGGILGKLESDSKITIESCVNIADLTAPYPSGILNTSGNSTIENCLNLGNLNSNSTSSNYSAGICMTYNVNCKVSNCINTGKITLSNNNSVYPILIYNRSVPENPLCSECYYDSNILPTVTYVPCVEGIPSSELDTLLVLEDWYNKTEPDSQYPIPSTIQEAFENKSSCWDIIFEAAEIEVTAGYVPGAYYVNGEAGDDGNDGSSIGEPYQKLTKAITNAIASDAKTVYVSGTLDPSNQEVTNPSNNQNSDSAIFYIEFDENPFSDNQFIEIIGEGEAAIFDAQNKSRVLSTGDSYNFKMKNIQFLNGKTTGCGAAIYFYQGNLELDNCKISDNSSTNSSNGNAYNGIYTYGGDSVLKMTNTTCEDSIYLYATTATIGSNCTIGTASPEATDGFITLDSSTLKLDGENIFIYKPIYVKSPSSSIQIGNYYSHGEQITIKLSSSITDDYNNSDPYTLVSECNGTKSNYFTIECEDSTKTATLSAEGKITVSNKSE